MNWATCCSPSMKHSNEDTSWILWLVIPHISYRKISPRSPALQEEPHLWLITPFYVFGVRYIIKHWHLSGQFLSAFTLNERYFGCRGVDEVLVEHLEYWYKQSSLSWWTMKDSTGEPSVSVYAFSHGRFWQLSPTSRNHSAYSTIEQVFPKTYP